jgi:hypothetical protein
MGRRKKIDIPAVFPPSGWNQPCPMGGLCIDSGNPNDCQVNRFCVPFQHPQNKRGFDALPDRFAVRIGDEPAVCFKNENQVKFYLTDLPYGDLQRVQIIPLSGH